jgi:hypothetical protein
MSRYTDDTPLPRALGQVLKTNTHIIAIGEGKKGVVQTLDRMEAAIKDTLKKPQFREIIQAHVDVITKDCENDPTCNLQKLFKFVKHEVRYKKDMHGVETIQWPHKTLQYGQGDCDCKSTLLATMLMLAHPPITPIRLVVVAADATRTSEYSHVYLHAKLGTEWVPLESIVKGARPGWEVPGPYHKGYMEVSV